MTHPSRRRALQWLGASMSAGLLPGVPWGSHPLLSSAAAPGGEPGDDRRLVLLYLEGGNDGLNTVVPFADDVYHRARPRLALPAAGLPRLDELTGLHPALAPWERLFDEGQLSVVRNVGLDVPDRSHFVARDILHAGRRAPEQRHTGWVGRALDGGPASSLPGIALGADEAPLVLKGVRRSGLTLDALDGLAVRAAPSGATTDLAGLAGGMTADPLSERLAHIARDAYKLSGRLEDLLQSVPSGGGYPDNPLAERLSLAARLVRASGGPRVLWTSLGGFDTHAVQAGTHSALLGQLSGATTAFIDDLHRDGTDERTLVLIYSEFGRRVAENGSGGTDHGAAAPLFALGGGQRGGLIGPPPDLEDLIDGDVRMVIDQRAVFGEAAERWLGWPAGDLFDEAPSFAGYVA